MKRRLTVNSLALGNLRAGPRSQATLMLGIVLAIFFSSTMFLMGQSIYESARLSYERRHGGQDAIFYDEDAVTPEMLMQSGCASQVGAAYVIGDLEEAELALGYYDEAGAELLGRRCLRGRLPEKAGEIAVEPTVLNRLRVEADLGDELTLTFRVPTGHGRDFLPQPAQKTYVVVGILEGQVAYQQRSRIEIDPDYERMPSLLVSSAERVEPGGRPIMHLLVKFAPGMTAAAFEEYQSAAAWNLSAEYFLFGFSSMQTGQDESARMIFMLVFILGGVLVLASCLGIVNAFSARLSERRAQIGMLRAVGATRRQIRSIFGREALFIALATALPAIGLSCLVTWGLMKALGDWTVFYVNPWFLPLNILLSISCVMLAAALPLLEASRTSPMQAIRETSLLRAKKRARIRSQMRFDVPRLLAKRHLRLYKARQAGIAGMVALSLFIIAFGFYFLSHASGGQDWRYDYEIRRDGRSHGDWIDIYATRLGFTQGEFDELARLPLVAEVGAGRCLRVNLLLDEVTPYVTQNDYGEPTHLAKELMDDAYAGGYPQGQAERKRESWTWQRERYEAFRAQHGFTDDVLTVNFTSMTPEMAERLQPYVLSGRIDIRALNEGREVLLVAPDVYSTFEWYEDGSGSCTTTTNPQADKAYDLVRKNDMFFADDDLSLCYLYMEGERRTEDEAGGYDFLTDVSRVDARVKIGAILSETGEASWFLGAWSGPGDVVTTNAGLQALGMTVTGYDGLAAKLTETPDLETEVYLDEALEHVAGRVSGMELQKMLVYERESEQWARVLIACALAVVLLFFAVCASMVNNAMTNRVRSDRRAIGTLRAVGAPLATLVASYRLQVLMLLLGGVAAGTLLSAGLVLWLYALTGWDASIFPVSLWWLWAAQAGFVALLVLLCGLNLRARIRSTTRASIVENVREL